VAQDFYRPYVLPVTQVKAVKETQSTEPNQWPGLILSSSTTRLLTERALLTLHRFSNASSSWRQLNEQPGIQRVQSTCWHFAFALCCHSNETRALIANPSNSVQLWGTPTILPSYIQVRAVMWACSCGQTQDTQMRVTTIFRVIYDAHEM